MKRVLFLFLFVCSTINICAAADELSSPSNLNDCLKELNASLPPDVLEEIKSSSEYSMNKYHLTIGKNIINWWVDFEGSKLKEYFIELGIEHLDNVSDIILTSFWRYLNKEPLRLDEQIKNIKDFWEKQENLSTPIETTVYINEKHNLKISYPVGWRIIETESGGSFSLVLCLEIDYPQGFYPAQSSPAIILTKSTSAVTSLRPQDWLYWIKESIYDEEITEEKRIVTNNGYQGRIVTVTSDQEIEHKYFFVNNSLTVMLDTIASVDKFELYRDVLDKAIMNAELF